MLRRLLGPAPWSGKNVWHYSLPMLTLGSGIAGFFVVLVNLPMSPDDAFTGVERLVWTSVCVVVWWFVIARPRTALDQDTMHVVHIFRTRHVRLVDIVSAVPTWGGTDVTLTSGKTITCGTLQPSVMRWLGRPTWAHHRAHRILCASAASRGEPDPQMPMVRRGLDEHEKRGVVAALIASVVAAVSR